MLRVSSSLGPASRRIDFIMSHLVSVIIVLVQMFRRPSKSLASSDVQPPRLAKFPQIPEISPEVLKLQIWFKSAQICRFGKTGKNWEKSGKIGQIWVGFWGSKKGQKREGPGRNYLGIRTHTVPINMSVIKKWSIGEFGKSGTPAIFVFFWSNFGEIREIWANSGKSGIWRFLAPGVLGHVKPRNWPNWGNCCKLVHTCEMGQLRRHEGTRLPTP